MDVYLVCHMKALEAVHVQCAVSELGADYDVRSAG